MFNHYRHLMLAPYCYYNRPLLPCLQLTNLYCFISSRLTLTALLVANQLLTALPAVTTVYKIELYSLEYNPAASTVLLLKPTRSCTDIYASYISLTLPPLLKPFHLPFYKGRVGGLFFFYGLGRAIIKGGDRELGGIKVLKEE